MEIMLKAPRIMAKAPRLMQKATPYIDHLRQLWLSIKENQR